MSLAIRLKSGKNVRGVVKGSFDDLLGKSGFGSQVLVQPRSKQHVNVDQGQQGSASL